MAHWDVYGAAEAKGLHWLSHCSVALRIWDAVRRRGN